MPVLRRAADSRSTGARAGLPQVLAWLVGGLTAGALQALLAGGSTALERWDAAAMTPLTLGGVACGLVQGRARPMRELWLGLTGAFAVGCLLVLVAPAELPRAQAPAMAALGLSGGAACLVGALAGWCAWRRLSGLRTPRRGRVWLLATGGALFAVGALPVLRATAGLEAWTVSLLSGSRLGLPWIAACVAVCAATRLPHAAFGLAATAAAWSVAAALLPPDGGHPRDLVLAVVGGVLLAILAALLQAAFEEWTPDSGAPRRRRARPTTTGSSARD